MKEKETKGGGRSQRSKTSVSNTGDSSNSDILPVTPRLTPYDIFQRCIKRAQNLIDFHSDEIGNETEEHFCDAYRAAIVLSISALDAFIRAIVTEKINNMLVDNTKDLPEKLSTYLKGLLSVCP